MSDAGEAPSADQPAGEEGSAGADAAQQQPAGSLQTEGDRGLGSCSLEEKDEEASSPIATGNKWVPLSWDFCMQSCIQPVAASALCNFYSSSLMCSWFAQMCPGDRLP